ncbi:MAG: hypothetical protein DWI57_14645 [Chloroflexi bacterium]|nr:MAG: hypothetical protein DWI57_14645 [Chloroflexota bacterium]
MQMTASEQQKAEDPESLDERARKRQAIGLSAVRPTAKAEAYHPPVQTGVNGLPWLAVVLLLALLAVTLWLLLRATLPGQPMTATGGNSSSALLRDDFMQPVLGLAPDVVTSDWSMGYVGDLYQIRVDQPGVLAWTTLGQIDLGAYRYDTSLMLTGSSGDNSAWGYAGLIARYQNDQNFYLFVVDGRGKYQVQAQEQGNWRTLQPWSDTPLLAAVGGENLLGIADDGHSLSFFVGPDLLYSTDDLRLPVGDVGLLAGSRSQGTARALYDWVRIEPIPLAR